jgi:hypothetical protein
MSWILIRYHSYFLVRKYSCLLFLFNNLLSRVLVTKDGIRISNKTHVMWPLPTVVTWPQTQGKHFFPCCWLRVFRGWSRNDVLLLLHVETCLRSCVLAMVNHVTILIMCMQHNAGFNLIYFIKLQYRKPSFMDANYILF